MNNDANKNPIDKRRMALNALAIAMLVTALISGVCAKKVLAGTMEDIIEILTMITLLLPVLCFIINLIARHKYVKNLNQKSVAENQQYWYSLREASENTIVEKLSVLRRIIRIQALYSILLAVCAIVAAFGVGVIRENGSYMGLLIFCYIILSGVVSRIRLKKSETFLEEDKTYVSEKDYPFLYALAEKAAAAIGCAGKIKISVLDDFNAGAVKINDIISIQLGAILLNVLSEEEVYCVFLHEFSHIKEEVQREKINNYYQYLSDVYDNTITHFYAGITRHLFTFIDLYFDVEYKLYLYAASLVRENDADTAMALYGNREMAASALVKMKYYELYDWEKGTYDMPCSMESEEYDTESLQKEVQRFKEAVQSNGGRWNQLIDNEILARSATHPILKMRLETLGVGEAKDLYPESDALYTAECKKAMAYVSAIIAEQSQDSYKEYRKHHYIESKELVETWESNGRCVVAEEYGDVCDALRCLGRNREALALCEQAIASLDDAGACYAYFIKGSYLLHSYDDAGIDYVYKAIENNQNYIEEGLEVIGSFCCLTGQEDQLEIYRERAITIAEQGEIYAEVSVLNKKDRLSAESLPEGMLEDILAYIIAENSEPIEKIYLIRKTITEDFFTSVFVIKMASDTEDDTRYKILHRTFNYLDTCSDWQFSLFDYEDVEKVKVEEVAGSCVWEKEKWCE